jgi:predicted ATP-dependent protease
MDTPLLLTVPRSDGEPFAGALVPALRDMATHWDDASEHGGPAALSQVVSRHLDDLQSRAPSSTQPYLVKLRGALDTLAQAGAALPFDGDHIPAGHVSPDPECDEGAPVVVVARGPLALGDALLRANGGVLVVNADAVDFGDLSAALFAGSLSLVDSWPRVPLSVRVALIGTGEAYNNLSGEAFTRLFRYELWANPVTSWTQEAEAAYAALVAGVAQHYRLPPLDPSGVARIIEECARRAGSMNRSRLSTDLALPHDLAAEAAHVAASRGAIISTGTDVEATLAQRRGLQAADGRWVREAILAGTEITPTFGTAIGQINGLGIIEDHPWESIFAVPMRISATVSPGRDETLLDIEHAAGATDADHVRGEMTAEGYLANRYSQDRPLSLLARVRFEQEHGASGGDSASAAILFALLSALAQIPIRRSLAVTGAVGQYGELQPIGGVNLKIEGFWELCRVRRAGGERPDGGFGVVIPAVNARDLMLRREVVESIEREGWFQIYPIGWVDEGIPLLMEVSAEALHERVQARLQRFHESTSGERWKR